MIQLLSTMGSTRVCQFMRYSLVPDYNAPGGVSKIYTWTKSTDNSTRQTLVSGQVASLHV